MSDPTVRPDQAPAAEATPVRIVFKDPYVKSVKAETAEGIELHFPLFEAEALPDILRAVRSHSRVVFAQVSRSEIQSAMDRLDASFADPDSPDVRAIVDLIHRIDGFSKHDIERFGLGIFRLLVDYDRALIGRFVKQAFGTRRPVETAFGHLQRFGANSPFVRRREPGLVSHFASGNVVGYSAILTRIGLPVENGGGERGGATRESRGQGVVARRGAGGGAAQVIKLPSTSAVFPMLYLSKMAEFAPLVRQTMACGYWKGGDRTVEDLLLAESDAVNVLGSEATVRDIGVRAGRLGLRPVILGHGHKVGAAYISREFAGSSALCDKVIEGLVRDISAFDGAACYCTKNVYVQGDHVAFAETLAGALGRFASTISPVNPSMKPVGRGLGRVFAGAASVLASDDDAAFVRLADKPVFWFPDEAYRYVQVMPADNMKAVADALAAGRHFLQTVIVAVPDGEILDALELLGGAGASNIHYPGSAALLNVYEEPHDGDFDFVKIRYPYKVRFAATNFKRNADWLRSS
ncbi:MAG: acyl-CoA reductase [Candidatus Aminicenantales bacterium]